MLNYLYYFQNADLGIPFSKVKVPGSSDFKYSDDSILPEEYYSDYYSSPIIGTSTTLSEDYSIPAPSSSSKIVSELDDSQLTPEIRNWIALCLAKGINFKITSGYSTSGHASDSRHYEGGAIDIKPINGESYETLLTKLASDPDIVDYMQKNYGGILDERTNKTGRSAWSGAHLHISFKTPRKAYGEHAAVLNWEEIKNKYAI